jgi:hypothetical protein
VNFDAVGALTIVFAQPKREHAALVESGKGNIMNETGQDLAAQGLMILDESIIFPMECTASLLLLKRSEHAQRAIGPYGGTQRVTINCRVLTECKGYALA